MIVVSHYRTNEIPRYCTYEHDVCVTIFHDKRSNIFAKHCTCLWPSITVFRYRDTFNFTDFAKNIRGNERKGFEKEEFKQGKDKRIGKHDTHVEIRYHDSGDYDLISVIRPGPQGIRTRGFCMFACSLYTYLRPFLVRPHSLAPWAKPLHPLTILMPRNRSLHQGIVKKKEVEKVLRLVKKNNTSQHTR